MLKINCFPGILYNCGHSDVFTKTSPQQRRTAMVSFKVILVQGKCHIIYAMRDITALVGITGRVRDIKRLPGEVSRQKKILPGKVEYTILANFATLMANKNNVNAYVVR